LIRASSPNELSELCTTVRGRDFSREKGRTLIVADWNSQISSPYYYLIVGVISFSAAVISTWTGKTYGKYGHGLASRAKEPTDFWWTVTIYYIGGACFIGYFLYKVYGHAN
jgi:hypothetical protein